jgi:hypothetical protein
MLSGLVGKKIVYSAQDIKNSIEIKANILKNQLKRINDYKTNKKTEYDSVIPLKIYLCCLRPRMNLWLWRIMSAIATPNLLGE